MKKDDHFWELQRTLSAEFSKYVLSHPETDDQIPDNAQIVFHIKGQDNFNQWSEEINRSQREAHQPVIILEVDGISPLPPLVKSRLINPHLEVVAK